MLPRLLTVAPPTSHAHATMKSSAATRRRASPRLARSGRHFVSSWHICLSLYTPTRGLTYYLSIKVTQNQTAVQCHVRPHEDMRFVPVIITFFILTFIVVLLRVAARVVSHVKFWYDDYFNIAAFVRRSTYRIVLCSAPFLLITLPGDRRRIHLD